MKQKHRFARRWLISHVLPQMATLSLLQPTNAKADWSNEEESKVLVSWDYLPNDNAHNYVWDSRAEMSLTIEMRNREGELIGTYTIQKPLTLKEAYQELAL